MTPTAMSNAEYRKRRRRRSLLRAAIAITLGLITTAGVAWACALWSPSSRLVTAVSSAGQPSQETGLGVAGTITWREIPAQTYTTSAGIMCGGESSTYSMSMPAMLTPSEYRMAFGWPLPALEYRIASPTEHPNADIFAGGMRLIGGLSGWTGERWRGISGRNIPLTPRPVGFAVNTLAAAVPFFLLLGGWAHIRAFARARAGRCARCGYDARGLAQCPECGLETARPATVAPAGTANDFTARKNRPMPGGATEVLA